MFNRLNNLNKKFKIFKIKIKIYKIVLKYIVGNYYNIIINNFTKILFIFVL